MQRLNIHSFFKYILSLIPLVLFAQQMDDYRGQVLLPNHALNTPIDSLPVHPNSANIISSIGYNTALHPDFGTAWDDDGVLRPIGIPYNVVGENQPLAPITFVLYPDESDPGPWPIPKEPYIETVFDWRETDPGDRHMLIVDSSSGMLYETGNVYGNESGTEWEGGCGAVFDLNSNDLRPETWTSADAAGLPIFPLLIRFDEVSRALEADGLFHHAVRFTAVSTKREYIWPARHYASSSTNPNHPPMGLRVRLKAEVDISGFSPRIQVILRSMKKYGLIMSDNGGNWFFQGTHDDRWDDDDINTLKNLHGRDFEVVDIGPWMSRPGFDPNSAAVPPEASAIVNPSHGSPSKLFLPHNYPNPFNSVTTISYSLNSSGRISIKMFDTLGRMITILKDQVEQAGEYSLKFNADKFNLGSGIYIGVIHFNSEVTCLKMILIR